MSNRKSGKNVGKKGSTEVDVDDRLQAIVLTDSFETRFMPLTAERPRCLMQLANVPLIEYTLEFLAKAGANEVYLICASHADQIDEYIESSKWNLPWSPFKISTLMSPEARSTGDVMRDLDNRGVITGDFVLVSGDVVTNLDFNKMYDFHKRMRLQDKDHISTMCLSKAPQFHFNRTIDPAVFVLDKTTNRCIYYQNLSLPNSKKRHPVEIDPELLDGVDEFVMRNDLIDCRIDICSPHVPPIFQENFDYQLLRTDFVKGVISSDLLGKHIYAYLTDEYAMRVESWQAYDMISKDFLGRLCYPLVPDSNILDDQSYTYESRGHIYKEKNVVLAQSCKIGKCTAIGSRTTIGEGTIIESSIIGRGCHIGDNITIRNSYIWDSVYIGDNSTVEHSIIASDVRIGRSVLVNDGCIIGFSVVLDNNANVPAGQRISSQPIKSTHHDIQYQSDFGVDSDESEASEGNEDDEIKSDIIRSANATNIVGAEGVGFVYESDSSDHDGDDYEPCSMVNTLAYEVENLYLSDTSISSTKKKTKKKRSLSISSVYTDREDSDGEDDAEDFEREGIATVTRAMENDHDMDTALLELNTLRMSMNVTYHELRTATVIALLNRVYHFVETQTLTAKDATPKVFNQWGLLFKRQAFDHEECVDLMNILMEQTLNIGFEKPDLVLFSALNSLYDNDVLEEEVIYLWWDRVSDDQKYTQVKGLITKWIDWLKNADEESSEEEDTEED